MPASPSHQPTSSWRLLLLAVAVVAIVVLPFVLQGMADERRDDAVDLHTHTLEVESQLNTLVAAVRNLEAASLAIAEGIHAPVLDERVASARERIEPALEALQQLTRDNPAQQVRIGELKASVNLRLAQVDRIIAAGEAVEHDEIETLVLQFPIQATVEEILAQERVLLGERSEDARLASRQSDMIRWGSMLAQLLLLAVLVVLATRELGRRLAAERGSQRASARAAAVLDTVREPIVLVDEDLRVVMHNAAFAELFGVDGEVRGEALAEVGNGAWRDEATLRRLRDVLARGRELWDFEVVQRTADDLERVMLVNARRMPLPDSDDDVALVTASDVSAQKASETHIRELNRQLEGKVEQVSDVNRELEAFSYSVSHDLRAPLRHIAGFADKLGRHLGDGIDEKSRHYLDVIGSSAKRMASLIDDLLVYSRLGRSALRLQAVDMQSLVEETRAMLDANAALEYPGHHVDWRIAPMPVLVADENMLRQVWLNLLGNAVKYSSQSEPAVVEVGYRQDEGGEHHFSIRDNGAGFDMAYAGKLFGVFQRLHAASEFSGTGIGLASVKRVLVRHNGRAWAESRPGEGATFHFTLPASLEPDNRRDQRQP